MGWTTDKNVRERVGDMLGSLVGDSVATLFTDEAYLVDAGDCCEWNGILGGEEGCWATDETVREIVFEILASLPGDASVASLLLLFVADEASLCGDDWCWTTDKIAGDFPGDVLGSLDGDTDTFAT